VSFTSDLTALGAVTAGAEATRMRREQAAQRDLENRVRAARDPEFAAALAEAAAAPPTGRSAAVRADAERRRAEARATPITGGMRTTLIVIAVLSALTVVGLPVTVLIVLGLRARSPEAIARRARAAEAPIDYAAEARRADELGLTESAKMWRSAEQ